ncbi:amino acid permease-domain-containing protein [Phyllosticta citriasiana]|uniref:Amino acid permease-domain-containing protein n=1 Tax=Phyllosticta citriasiana TaxID=595635 RepID=A0ABR1KMG3_9PEZI
MSELQKSLVNHIQFIALGGTIGTGFFLCIGKIFATSGLLSLLLGYTFTGLAVFGMMQCLGEMATWLPLPGALPQYCARYVDPAIGFAVGWNTWYQSSITLCAEFSAAAVVIGLWDDEINQAAWITIIIVVVVSLNIFAVAIYGEDEFIFASIKIITIIGLLILALCIDLGAGKEGRLEFRYWNSPGAMREYIGSGATGRFLGLSATLINAAFSYGGVEMVAVAAGEAENPRVNIPKAVRPVFWRILFFYTLDSLAIGVLVLYDDPHLLDANAVGAAQSPWVIAINRAGISALPSIINAVIPTTASSFANAFLFTGSRYFFAPAQNEQAPRFLLKCRADTVFQWFQNLTTISQLCSWCAILVAYIRFRAALIAQNVDRSTLVFRSRGQRYLTYAALSYFLIIIIFNGFAVFTNGNRSVDDLITAHIGIPIFACLYLLWKILKRDPFVKAAEADIWSGKAALDAR